MLFKDFDEFVNKLTLLISYASKCKSDKDRVEAVKAVFACVLIHLTLLINTIESQATVSDRYRKFYDLLNSLYQKSYDIHNDMIRLHIVDARGISLCRRLNMFVGHVMTHYLYCEPRTTKKFLKNPYTQSAVKPSGAFPC